MLIVVIYLLFSADFAPDGRISTDDDYSAYIGGNFVDRIKDRINDFLLGDDDH